MRSFRPLVRLGLLAALVGCSTLGGLGTEERNRLVTYLENGANYYGRDHFKRALNQWGKALELDPDNIKARLGIAMAHYQISDENTREGMQHLLLSQKGLVDLLDESLGSYEWKATLAFGLVQSRWVKRYDRKIRLTEEHKEKGEEIDEEELESDRKQFAAHVRVAKSCFDDVLASADREPVDALTCLLELARLCAYQDNLEESLTYARRLEQEVMDSKKLWEISAREFPRERATYELLLAAAENHEAQLRDVMANVLFKLDRMQEAEAELDKLLALDDKKIDAYMSRGIIRQKRKDWDRARSDFRLYLELTDLPRDHASVMEASRRLAQVEVMVDAEDRLREETEAAR